MIIAMAGSHIARGGSALRPAPIGAAVIKRMTALFTMLLILLVFPPSASAVETKTQRVFDQAELFTPSQAQELEEAAAGGTEQTGLELVVVTTQDALGKSARDYADDYYDEKGFGIGAGADGALFLIDMDNREIWISTHGKAIDRLNDARIEAILDDAYARVSQEDYAGAANCFLQGAVANALAPIASNQHRYDEETGQITPLRQLSVKQLLLFGVISLAAGGLACAGVAAKYQMRIGGYQYPYRQMSRMSLARREDRFLNQTVTARRIPKSSGTGHGGGTAGRSTTHRSSSGRSHGGGGRKF